MAKSIALDSQHASIIRAVLLARIPQNRVWMFGSRVGSLSKPHSDVDLVIIDPPSVSENTLALLKLDFEESNLPIRIDVCVWSQISVELQQIIKHSYVELS